MNKLQIVLAVPVGIAVVMGIGHAAIWVHEMIRAGWL